MAKLHEIIKQLEAARQEYHEKAPDMTPSEAHKEAGKQRELQGELQKILTEGADDCDGGHRPHGIFHKGTPNPFEIGDLVERNKRVRGATLEEAVDKWNENDYMPPREPETIEGTHTDASGKVVSKQSAKLKKA